MAPAAAARLMEHFPVLAPGIGACAERAEVEAPWDRSVIGTVDCIDAGQADRALETAFAIYQDKSRWLPPAQRIEVLQKTAALMAERGEELAVEAAREGGKPLADSRVEVARAIDGMHSCAEALRTEAGREIPMNLNAASAGHMAFTRKYPIGVVLGFSAFNHPLNLIVHQVGPAIAAGCPAIIKPALNTPLSCMRFVAMLRQAGLPEDYVQAVNIRDHDISARMVRDGRVAFFSFIGSGAVGWKLRSELAPGARCALEHGGIAPVIVAADADIDDALPLLAKGGFYHAGQVCVSVQRVYAERALAERVAEGLAAAGAAMPVGDPTLPDTAVGPLIRPGEVDRVEAWVGEAVAGGARLVAGGKRLSATAYAPTVLLNPPDDARVSAHEVFGPVICVYACDDVDAGIARANAGPYAFQAAVFSRSLDTALHCYHQLEAAAVMINDHTAFRVDWMPFAGLKQSGHGVGGIPYTFEDMQVDKLMVVRSPAL